MGRIRSIKPEFFLHEELYDLEKELNIPIRIAFAGLWTQSDRAGRFKWKPRSLKAAILPHDEIDFSRVLHALWTRGFIEKYRFEDEDFGWIPTFEVHQVINNRESASVLPEPLPDRIVTCDSRVRHATGTPAQGKGREGKGKEGEGGEYTREENLCWDIEKYLAEHPREWEAILMSHSQTQEPAAEILKKYHLWCQKKEEYPRLPLALIAGFKLWLLNEKDRSNGTNQQSTAKSNGQPGVSAARKQTLTELRANVLQRLNGDEDSTPARGNDPGYVTGTFQQSGA